MLKKKIYPLVFLCNITLFSGVRFSKNPIGDNLDVISIRTGIGCVVDGVLTNSDNLAPILRLRSVNTSFFNSITSYLDRPFGYQNIAQFCLSQQGNKLVGLAIKQITGKSFFEKIGSWFSCFGNQNKDNDVIRDSHFLYNCAQAIFTNNIGKIGFSSFFSSIKQEQKHAIKITDFGILNCNLIYSNRDSIDTIFDIQMNFFSFSQQKKVLIVYLELPDIQDSERMTNKEYYEGFATIIINRLEWFSYDRCVLHIYDPYMYESHSDDIQLYIIYLLSLILYKCPNNRFEIFHNLKPVTVQRFLSCFAKSIISNNQPSVFSLAKNMLYFLPYFIRHNTLYSVIEQKMLYQFNLLLQQKDSENFQQKLLNCINPF